MERDIDYVIAVAECGSISQAAEVLYISQPSLSPLSRPAWKTSWGWLCLSGRSTGQS